MKRSTPIIWFLIAGFIFFSRLFLDFEMKVCIHFINALCELLSIGSSMINVADLIRLRPIFFAPIPVVYISDCYLVNYLILDLEVEDLLAGFKSALGA